MYVSIKEKAKTNQAQPNSQRRNLKQQRQTEKTNKTLA